MQEIKIKTKVFSNFWVNTVWILNNFLTFFSLRNSRKFWGVVYDSVTKQPLDPVIIKLIYAHSGEQVQTCVTDLAGRYAFLAQPGKFKIFAKKSNYTFPSNKILTKDDGIFTDIYRGEFFELKNESEVVAPNIPMDSLTADWNQAAKLKVFNTYPYLKLLLKKSFKVIFWFGFVFALLFVFKDFYKTPWFERFALQEKILTAYFLLLLLNYFLPEIRLWGRLVDKQGHPISGAALELANPLVPSVVFAKYITSQDGRFLLRANAGEYIMRCRFNSALAELKLRVGHVGVVNATFKLVDK